MSAARRAEAGHDRAVALPQGVQLTTLGNGTRVITEAMPHVRSATVGWWIGVGSRDEPDAVAGASHFLEHLLFKGTRRRSARDIAEAIDAVGGEANAFTAQEYTCFFARTLDRDVGVALDVVGDMIHEATCASEDVEAERRVVLEEILMHLDSPDELAHSLFCESHFAGHPLGREVLGSEGSVRAVGRDDIAGWYQRHYTPDNLVVAAAGNVDHDHIVAGVRDALGDGAEPSPGRPVRTAPGERGSGVATLSRPTEQTQVVLGGPGMGRGDERRWAVAVLDVALGGSMASRLFQEIRERRGLAYTVGSEQAQHVDAGTFDVFAGTNPSQVGELVEVLRAELDDVRERGLSDEELTRARASLAGSIVLGLEDTGSRMVRLGRSQITDTPLLEVDDVLARIDAVDHDAVAEAARAVLSGPFTLALVGPVDDVDVDALARHCAAA